MTDRQSATKFIKALNPNNKSGPIKQSLDMLNQLKQMKAGQNPKMSESVGAGNLVGALQSIFNAFMKQKKKKLEDKKEMKKILTPEEQAELDRLNRMANELALAIKELPVPANTTPQGEVTAPGVPEFAPDTPDDPNNPYVSIKVITS